MVDSFYLAQSYAQIPKHGIKDNLNLLAIFPTDDVNLKHVYHNHVNTDMSFDKFKELCSICWRESFNFIVIDKTRQINNGRYRRGFDEFFLKE